MPISAKETVVDKVQLRQHMRAQRRAIPKQSAQQSAERLCQQIKSLFSLQQPKRIALYQAHDGEIDLLPTLQWLLQQNCHCYLPVVHPVRSGYLWFAPYQASDSSCNLFGTIEPAYTPQDIVAPWEVDWVLVPLVALDPDRYRLGMGGGFYDRSFAYNQPTMLGCAYALQCVPQVPRAAWDIQLDYIVTEREIICG